MAIVPPPVVRYMIVCDEVLRDASRPGKPLIVGLTTIIHATEYELFPVHVPRLCVFLALTEGRSVGSGRIRLVLDDTDEEVFVGQEHRIEFSDDPLHIVGVVFRILDCQFPRDGFYNIEFWYDEQMLARQTVQVR